jgi:alcohol dehydrogenase YqhD (iron-dependent ADH family)
MLGNFSYKNATKLYFGDDSLKYLNVNLSFVQYRWRI